MENRIERGEVYFIYLDPTFGREIGGYKTRPVVVASINDLHQRTRIVTVVPGTSVAEREKSSDSTFPNVVRVVHIHGTGLSGPTDFLCHQVRAVDQGRMTSRAIGRVSREDLRRIEAALRHTLGF